MSSPSRLLVVSCTPGTGSSSIARAAARRRGAVLVERPPIDADHGESSLPFDEAVLASEEVEVAAGLARLEELHAIARHLAAGECVVWNAGDVDGALRVLAAVDAVPVLVGSMGPELRAAAGVRVDELQDIRSRMQDAAPAVLLVVSTGRGERRRVARVGGQLAVLGMGLAAVVVNRVPDRDDPWPKAWAKQQRRRARAVRATARGLGAVVRFIRWFPGDSVSDRRLARRLDFVDSLTPGPAPAPATIEATEDGYRWQLAWPGVESTQARIGRVGDDAVFVVSGMTCMAPLPSLIARCSLVSARLRDGVLTIDVVPNAAVWRTA